MILNSLYSYYDGVGNAEYTSALPIQTLPDSKKGEAWQRKVMDRLEQIGIRQVAKNLEFRDYYRMVEGRLIYSDFENAPEITKDIAEIRQEMDLPTYIKHYDLIGVVANLLAGELDNHKDKLRIDSTDEYSKNEYIREKSNIVNQYLQQKFQLEIKRGLLMKGINPDDLSKIEDEEQKAQAMQMLQEESNKIIDPREQERSLNKNFKVKAVKWGEQTLEEDNARFLLPHKEEQEFIDYFLTGRFFRHYHIGYDFYKPERWEVENVFFSQDLSIKFPQDAEYVGRITWMSASDIIMRYGDKLSLKLQEKIGKVHDSHSERDETERADYTTMKKRPVGSYTVPHEDYFNHQLTVQLQEAFGAPLGEKTTLDAQGNPIVVPGWISDYARHESFFGSNTASLLREDIDVRRDAFRVTEAYFRSFKRMAYIRYETPSGIIAQEMVTDDLLTDFLKENEIKQYKTISLSDFEEGDEVNTLAYFYIPEVWKGKKIGAGGGLLADDIYFDIKPLEFQIKGDSNIFDIKLPVAGIITNSNARKLRPYQMGYNLCMNQIFNLLEKEIGMFFLMDINFLPSEFKDLGDSAEILSELRELARDLGFIPVDTSRQNLQGQNPQATTFIKQDISYDVQIQRRAALAEMYKRLALEQIGITEQRKGTPDQYSTAEGVKVGQEASYAQTKLIFNQFNEARKKATELHINIAQYCQSNNKDISLFSRKSDDELAYLEFTDPYFSLRDLNVRAISDPQSRKHLERLRELVLSNNTLENDVLDFANIMASDSMVRLIEVGKQSRARKDKQTQEARAHEEKITGMSLESAAKEKQLDREWNEASKEKDRDNFIERERIKALGRAADKQSDTAGIDEINKAADQAAKEENMKRESDRKDQELQMKQEDITQKHRETQQQLRLKLMELKDRREARKHEKFVATVNKN